MDNKNLLIGLERFRCCFASYSKAIKEDASAKNIGVDFRVSGLFADGSATFAKFSIKTSEAKLKISGQLNLNFEYLGDYEYCDDVACVMLDGQELTGLEKYNVAMIAMLKELKYHTIDGQKITERHTETHKDGVGRFITDSYKAELANEIPQIKCKNKYLASDNTVKAFNIIGNYIDFSDETNIGDGYVTVSDKDLECFRKGDFNKSSFADFREGLVVILKEYMTTNVDGISKREEKYSCKHYYIVDRRVTVDNKPAAVAKLAEDQAPADVAKENK